MERKKFLELCQKVSALGMKDVPDEFCVSYHGFKYFPYGYEMRFVLGVPVHNAILHDVNTKSILYAGLEKVKEYEQG